MVAPMIGNGKRELEPLQQLVTGLDEYVREAAREGTPAHEVEWALWGRLLAIGWEAMATFFAAQGDGDLGQTFGLPDGRELNRLDQPHRRSYRSIFGEFVLDRAVYGTREGQKIEFVPLDQRLQLPESEYSYVLQDWCESLGTEHSFARVSETLDRILKQRVPVDSVERIGRQMSESVEPFRESQAAAQEEEEAAIFVVTADNKGVPMRRAGDSAPAGAKRRKGEKANKKQMATLGGAYTVDPKVRTPDDVVGALFREDRSAPEGEESPEARAQNKRVCARLSVGEQRGQDEVFAWLAEQVNQRAGDGNEEIPCLMDGQSSLWNDRRRYLPGARFVEILDLLHVTSKIWEAAYLFYKEGSAEAVEFARERILRILEGKVGYVIGGLRQMGTKRRLRGAKLKKLRGICDYLEANRKRMRYDDYLAKGYPIATGVIEGACRYVIKDRMERAGMRWTVEGAQAMLDLRTTYVNGQWEEFQNYRIEQERRRLYPHETALNAVAWPVAA